MASLPSFFVAALTGVLGAFATGIVATALNDWFHFYNNRDIGSGLVTLFVSVGGGVAFFALGLVVANSVALPPEPTFYRALGISCGTVVALTAVVLLVGRVCDDSSVSHHGGHPYRRDDRRMSQPDRTSFGRAPVAYSLFAAQNP